MAKPAILLRDAKAGLAPPAENSRERSAIARLARL
jgi:hypothetical protein